MLLFYIRHGDPIYSPDSLTPLGQRQAEAIAKRLLLYGVDKLFASTSNRAIETAQPTSELLKLPITQIDGANEAHAWRDLHHDGKFLFLSKTIIELFATPEMRALSEKWYMHPTIAEFDFGKGVDRIDRVTDDFFASLGYFHDRATHTWSADKPTDERVALFAHGGFGIFFLSSLLDIPMPYFVTHFRMTHSGMTVINLDEVDGVLLPQVLTLSNDSHLYKEGIMAGYNNQIRF